MTFEKEGGPEEENYLPSGLISANSNETDGSFVCVHIISCIFFSLSSWVYKEIYTCDYRSFVLVAPKVFCFCFCLFVFFPDMRNFILSSGEYLA